MELVSQSSQKLQALANSFDFKVFEGLKETQNGQDDLSPFCAFQRFCLLIVLINGGKVEENDAESMTKFLRQIEVYKQVKQID